MKTNYLTLLTMGRSLIRLKDRTGAYKLPTGNPFPKFGPSGRQGAVLPSAVRAPAPVAQPSLFAEPAAPPPAVPAPEAPPPRVAPSPAVPAKTAGTAPAAASFWSKMPKLPSFPGVLARFPAVCKFGRRSPAHDPRPRAQAELALEKVTVLRNDLSEDGLVVIKVAQKSESSVASPALNGPAVLNPWTRATARWIKLKDPIKPCESGTAAELRSKLAELQP